MDQFIAQLQAVWKQMDTTRRIIVVVVLLLSVTSIIYVAVWSSSPKYELLYSRLGDQDRNEIISKLDEMKVPYRVSIGGGIEVPNALSVRANLLNAGIPHGGVVGWEIFDKSSFSTTDFTNQINRQRAIAGELTRTLQRLDGIVDAKIILNLPDSGDYLFSEDKPEGTASVQLELRAPGAINQTQAEAIANLVAASTGIKAENVTIVDNYANDLTEAIHQNRGSKGMIANTSNLFAAKDEYETGLEKRVEGMLARVFGFNKSVVRVNADLDLDYQEVKSQTFADHGVPRSEQEKTETSRSTGSSATGAPVGSDTNITTYKAGENGNTSNYTEKSDRTTNYEINKVEEFRIGAPGKVKRLTLGVWVDGDLPSDLKQKVVSTISAAVGIDEDRGDKLTVETTKFIQPPQIPPEKEFFLHINWEPIIQPTIIGFLFIIWLLVLRAIVFPKQLSAPRPRPAAVARQFEAVVEDRSDRARSVNNETAAVMELSPEEQARIERLAAIERIAREKPAEVAVLLKAWLSEE